MAQGIGANKGNKMENRSWFSVWFEIFWKENGQKFIYSTIGMLLGYFMYKTGNEVLSNYGVMLMQGVAFVLATKIRGGKEPIVK